MNPLHYPSLELCKFLTEAGFLDETIAHYRKNNSDMYEITFGPWNDESYVCPSIAELLDELPTQIEGQGIEMGYCINEWGVQYGNDHETTIICKGSIIGLPNALAKMYLWLKENNHLPNEQQLHCTNPETPPLLSNFLTKYSMTTMQRIIILSFVYYAVYLGILFSITLNYTAYYLGLFSISCALFCICFYYFKK